MPAYFAIFAPFFRQWNSVKQISRLPPTVALLMLSGKADEVIPPAHMKQLWEAANLKQQMGTIPRYGKFVEFVDGMHSKQ